MSTTKRRAPKKRTGKNASSDSSPRSDRTASEDGSAEDRVLDLLTHPDYQPVKAATLLKKLGGSPQLKADNRTALDALLANGKALADRGAKLRARHRPGVSIGRIKTTRSGDAWVAMNDPRGRDHDVYVRRSDMADAHDGDEVEVRIVNRKGGRDGSRITGEVVSVIERQTTRFVGTYDETGRNAFVRVDGDAFLEPIPIGDPGAHPAEPGEKVVIDVLKFPSAGRPGEAVVIEVLGRRGDAGVDELGVMREFDLPEEFPDEVLAAASEEARRFDEEFIGDRLDLTKETVVTIDPKTARDFDDAISLKRIGNGHWVLGVHIADVAHFVKPGSALDKEAKDRATSVYLPGKVIPMLPEIISNGLASLQQGKVRYVKTCFIEFDPTGIPVKTRFANAAIKVTKRFAYEQVMPIVDDPDSFTRKVRKDVRHLLLDMYSLAMTLRKRRFAAGALEMHMPEVTLDLNKKGEVVGASEAHHDASHEIIEEFMLAANVAVAQALEARGLPFIRRVHDDPDEAKLKKFSEFVGTLGFNLKQYQSRPHLQALLDEVKHETEAPAVNYALLRSMKQAEYSPGDGGHYALAFPCYAHFTSPIRRYPDLTIHRLIDALCRGEKPKTQGEAELTALANHCSDRSRRADKAERELIRVKLLEYLEDRVGEEFDAVVTGVMNFGVFVRGVELPAEGMIPREALGGGWFDHDATAHTLTSRDGVTYRLGMPLKVKVAEVDVEGRNLQFELAETPQADSGDRSGGRGGSPKGDRGSSNPRGRSKGRSSSSRSGSSKGRGNSADGAKGGGRRPTKAAEDKPKKKRSRRR
ncbi:ribonuclease R [Alienimonas chondri]|uniref:Ribonuclease R n=1 Tax=Alienimonas chondri TaxID=2681879 RepID=A0ABX1V995_9PLAN|nr:ribonuclease R [Alienimonas chondri]NNJ24036.1 Ribonuclease R [Alienimonas chondri]